MKTGAKTLRNNFGLKATADEMDVATEPCFGENEKRNGVEIFTNWGGGGKEKVTYDFLA